LSRLKADKKELQDEIDKLKGLGPFSPVELKTTKIEDRRRSRSPSALTTKISPVFVEGIDLEDNPTKKTKVQKEENVPTKKASKPEDLQEKKEEKIEKKKEIKEEIATEKKTGLEKEKDTDVISSREDFSQYSVIDLEDEDDIKLMSQGFE
jgi:hypothetical protein